MNKRECGILRGDLLAALEHQRVQPGHWLVEGWTIRRQNRLGWCVYRTRNLNEIAPELFPTLTEALEWISDGASGTRAVCERQCPHGNLLDDDTPYDRCADEHEGIDEADEASE